MIFLQLNTLSKSEAIIEIVLILAIAALLGFILSKLLAISRLRLLQEEIDQKKIELAECRSVIAEEPAARTKPLVIKPTNLINPDPVPISTIPEDLKIIEGIGPKIEELLNKHGINNYSTLANMNPIRIAAILRSAGPRYQIHDPSSWPQQATLAEEGDWEGLKEIKIRLISGRPTR
jgi:predicted flap endonuclease-1-like 5' DNA nuclease